MIERQDVGGRRSRRRIGEFLAVGKNTPKLDVRIEVRERLLRRDGSLGGGETDAVSPENVFCRACERASSASDIRHFFSLNSVYEIP